MRGNSFRRDGHAAASLRRCERLQSLLPPARQTSGWPRKASTKGARADDALGKSAMVESCGNTKRCKVVVPVLWCPM
jgi:hypothetical protein